MGKVLIGISSWADPELIESGFYPPAVKTPAARLQSYAENFPVVEMDSSFHFLPGSRILTTWIEATPPGFMFDVKAFSLLTQHPTPFKSLPGDIREKTAGILSKEGKLYIHHFPADIIDMLWERFDRAVLSLSTAGKLGVVSFQFPPWFHPVPENYRYIAECKSRLSRYPLAVEFRTGSWLNDEHREPTLRLLRENGLGLVCVDEPQGFRSSVPPVAETTAPFGVVRFHGRNAENWEQKNISLSEKYNYLYSEEELKEWVPRIDRLAGASEKLLVIFKNKHQDFPVRNARQLNQLLNLPGNRSSKVEQP